MQTEKLEYGGCGGWEAAIAELHDGTLPPEDEIRLRRHARECGSCGALLAEAERGRAWARLLHGSAPVPPADLLGRILAQTPTGGAAGTFDAPGLAGTLVLPHPAALRGQREARALMTAAMAFFSVALTLSVTGLRVHDLEPSRVQAAVSRQFFGAKKEVVSFYDNLRVIRELEVTVESLRKLPAGSAEHPQPSARRLDPAALLAEGRIAVSERSPERTAL